MMHVTPPPPSMPIKRRIALSVHQAVIIRISRELCRVNNASDAQNIGLPACLSGWLQCTGAKHGGSAIVLHVSMLNFHNKFSPNRLCNNSCYCTDGH